MHIESLAEPKLGQSGYVLIFVLGALFVLSVITLGISTSTRIDAASVVASKRTDQAEYLLKGALQRVIWGLQSGQFLLDLEPKITPTTGVNPFQDVGGVFNRPLVLVVDGQTFKVQLDNGDWLVDPNKLTPDMWGRLGLALGLTPAAVEQLVWGLGRSQEAHQAVDGLPLFRTFQDISHLQGLPRAVLYGVDRVQQPGAVDMLVFGKPDLSLDINYSPALLYKVVHNATDPQLNRLREARAKGVLTGQDEQRIFGAPLVPSASVSPPSLKRLRVTLEFGQSNRYSGMTLLAFVDMSQPVAVVTASTLFFRQ